MRKIGILGGTFNPIHNGHLAIAKKSLVKFKLKEVWFIPTGIPPHKAGKIIASKKDRLNMTQLAIKGSPRFKLSKTEINRPGYSYAVDTFKRIRKLVGRQTRLFYILGMDSINEILTWKKPLELFKYCEFIIATRPKSSVRIFKRIMKFPPLRLNISKIHLLEIKIDISATAIREKLARNKSIKGLVPKSIERYIIDKKLYTS